MSNKDEYMRLPAASLLSRAMSILRDPPPEFVFEVAADIPLKEINKGTFIE